MKRPNSTAASAIVLIALALAAPAVAQLPGEQCPGKQAAEPDRKQLAGQWFVSGAKLYDEGRVDEALSAFLCSLEIVEHPNTMYNAGCAAFGGGEDKVALDLFKRYLLTAPDGPMADDAKQKIAEIYVRMEEEPEPEPKPLVEVAEPELQQVAESTEQSDSPPKPVGYTLIGVGSVGVVVGIALQITAGSAHSAGDATADYQVFKDERSRMESFQIGAITGFVAGGLLLVVGATYLGVSSRDEESSTAGGPRVGLALSPGGLAVEGSF